MIQLNLGETPAKAAINLTLLMLVTGVAWILLSLLFTLFLPFPGAFGSLALMLLLYLIFRAEDLYPSSLK